ncbi:hypothetical protein DMC30DRAFT_413919 [Rhodotorula diobovata]|uniref:Uncharacterized protein n=1 Tax=Rhodotorula diobovata TaxID=5288 RepID=A0A5C5G610_9BASI|nr:hypothetical protein DMC30DRAFT_413919 [Rhodotorula diobovata]
MPAFAGLQTLAYGAFCIYAGVRLCTSPDVLLVQVAPLTRLLEDKAGLQPHGAGDRASLALAGLALFALGYSSLMAVYTLDKKAQMNATSQRLFLAIGSYFLCQQTPHGSSLIALFGLVSLSSGLLFGVTVGWGDGNAVDLEIKARVEARRRADAATRQ